MTERTYHEEATDLLAYILEDADQAPSGRALLDECLRIAELLIEKNRKYGDSALNPVRCFSKASAIEQINVRLDDKISRLMSAQSDETEDVEFDLVGYIVLKRVATRMAKAMTDEQVAKAYNKTYMEAVRSTIPSIKGD